MNALLKQLIQIGMPENNGIGKSLTDEQMAKWLFGYVQEVKAEKANHDFSHAEVADALAALRKKVVALQLPVGHVEYSQYDYGVGDALNCVDTTIAKLGLAPKEKQ